MDAAARGGVRAALTRRAAIHTMPTPVLLSACAAYVYCYFQGVGMRKRLCVAMLFLSGTAVLAGSALYLASRHVPEFYRAARAADSASERRANDEFLENLAALSSNSGAQETWEAAFTSEQINGWLAVDLVKNHRGLMPPEFSNPRVAIDSRRVNVACRYQLGAISTVVSLEVEPYLAEANTLALRIRHLRAGRLPLPLATILDAVSRAARGANLRLRWQQADGDPVALVTLPQPRDVAGKRRMVQRVEFDDGEIYLSGHIESPEPSAQAHNAPQSLARPPGDRAKNRNRQR